VEGPQGWSWTRISASLEQPMPSSEWIKANTTQLAGAASSALSAAAPLLGFQLVKDRSVAFGGYSTAVWFQFAQTQKDFFGDLQWQLLGLLSKAFNGSTVEVSGGGRVGCSLGQAVHAAAGMLQRRAHSRPAPLCPDAPVPHLPPSALQVPMPSYGMNVTVPVYICNKNLTQAQVDLASLQGRANLTAYLVALATSANATRFLSFINNSTVNASIATQLNFTATAVVPSANTYGSSLLWPLTSQLRGMGGGWLNNSTAVIRTSRLQLSDVSVQYGGIAGEPASLLPELQHLAVVLLVRVLHSQPLELHEPSASAPNPPPPLLQPSLAPVSTSRAPCARTPTTPAAAVAVPPPPAWPSRSACPSTSSPQRSSCAACLASL
jgi:hypothetical protein